MSRRAAGVLAGIAALSWAWAAAATSYAVGPSRTYKTLQDIQALVQPGDSVELDGDATYPAGVWFHAAQSGTADQKITIRGLRVNGRRPVISGSGTGALAGIGMVLGGDHYVLESVELTGATGTCLLPKADDVTIRDVLIHDCAGNGVALSEANTGSVLLEYSEVHHCAGTVFSFNVFAASDFATHPGAVFRMQHCYIHDAIQGNNVRSRAERSEIYYNWIEAPGPGAVDLQLLGLPAGADPQPAHEDADVVGNVVISGTYPGFAFYLGGGFGEDGSNGRYRLVNNTIVLNAASPNSRLFRIIARVDSIEVDDNAFYLTNGSTSAALLDTSPDGSDTSPAGARIVSGSNNWVSTGWVSVPSAWTGTITGTDPGFLAASTLDVRLAVTSPLIDKGSLPTQGPAGHELPSPLPRPLYEPPLREALMPGTALNRAVFDPIDIGAFEFNKPVVPDAGNDASSASEAGADAAYGDAAGSDSVSGDDGADVDAMASSDVGVDADAAVADEPGAGTDAAVGADAGAGADGDRDVTTMADATAGQDAVTGDGAVFDQAAPADDPTDASAKPAADASPVSRTDAAPGEASPTGDAGDSGGCGCTVAGRKTPYGSIVLLAAGALALARRRRPLSRRLRLTG
jgi:MYXO-CTERM domain-containing protein